jgi:hypothetical protein
MHRRIQTRASPGYHTTTTTESQRIWSRSSETGPRRAAQAHRHSNLPTFPPMHGKTTPTTTKSSESRWITSLWAQECSPPPLSPRLWLDNDRHCFRSQTVVRRIHHVNDRPSASCWETTSSSSNSPAASSTPTRPPSQPSSQESSNESAQPPTGPILRRHSRTPARSRHSPRRAPPGESGRLPGALTCPRPCPGLTFAVPIDTTCRRSWYNSTKRRSPCRYAITFAHLWMMFIPGTNFTADGR